MFAFVSLGDDYFGNGVLAGLWTAMVVGIVCVAGGNASPTVYAPRITTTFYLGLVLFALTHSSLAVLQAGGVPVQGRVLTGDTAATIRIVFWICRVAPRTRPLAAASKSRA